MTDLRLFVESVKDACPIEDVVRETGSEFELKRSGGDMRGVGPNNDLVVRVRLGMYYWNKRGEKGDVFTWLENRHGWTFMEALEHLAKRAGMEMPSRVEVDELAVLSVRERESVFEVAQEVMTEWLLRDGEALEYAQGRGWDEDVIRECRLGFTGQDRDESTEAMRQVMLERGIDVHCPAAVAVLGYKGDVAGWCERHGIEAQENWLEWKMIPGMVGRKRLVYAHVQRGRVVYLSGRNILGDEVGKDGRMWKAYNLPVALVGERRPYLNHVWRRDAVECVVVEGQADAVSLGVWGISAMGLNGVALGDGELALLRDHTAIYLGADDDEAGHKAVARHGEKLGPLVRLVSWKAGAVGDKRDEVKDANDLLGVLGAEGLGHDDQVGIVRRVLDNSLTYVETVCWQAGAAVGAARDEAIKRALGVIVLMGGQDYSRYRTRLAKAMSTDDEKVSVRDLGDMVKRAAAAAEKVKPESEPVFTWGGHIGDWFVEYLYDKDTKKSRLAWRDADGRIDSGESVLIDGQRYKPYPPTDTMMNGGILFASDIGAKKSIPELIAIIEMFLSKIYLMPSKQMTRLIAYWVLMTWLYDCFETTIYLRAIGGAGSGKSELLSRIGLVSYRSMKASGADSTSSLFRSVERYNCVVILDEADISYSDTENDMVKFYNLGAMKNNPINRTKEITGPNGERDWIEIGFRTFCPKMIGARKDFKDDAVGSRSLTMNLMPREMTELKAAGIPLTVNNEIRRQAQGVRNVLLRWRLEAWRPEIEVDMEYYDLSISPRLNQVAGPLLAIAASEPVEQEMIRETLRGYYAESIIGQSMTLNARVIEALWKIWQYEDLRESMVREDAEGEWIKVGHVAQIANEIMDEMNYEDEEGDDFGDDEDDNGNKKVVYKGSKKKVSSRKVGEILREDFQLQISPRRRDGFWVLWNGPRLEGLAVKYGVDIKEFAPVEEGHEGSTDAAAAAEEKPVQGRMV